MILCSISKEWEAEIKEALNKNIKSSKIYYPLRDEEARTNRNIAWAVDADDNKELMEAIKKVPNHPAFEEHMEKLCRISKWKPNPGSQFTDEEFDETARILGLLLLACSGHRNQILEIVSVDDALGTRPNEDDPELATMTLMEFQARKRGKTKVEIRLNLDLNTFRTMTKFLLMRRIRGFPEEGPLLQTTDRAQLNMKRLMASSTWRKFQLPTHVAFRNVRSEIGTFYHENPETKDIDPVVLLAQSKAIQEKSYDRSKAKTYDRGAATLRKEFIPKSQIPVPKADKGFDAQETMANQRARLMDKLRMGRSEERGRMNRAIKKNRQQGYALAPSVKDLLVRSIFEVRVPSFTYCLLTGVPKDSKSLNVKPWTVLVAKFLADKANTDLWDRILHTKMTKPTDIWELARQVKNTLISYNRSRNVFPGLRKEQRERESSSTTSQDEESAVNLPLEKKARRAASRSLSSSSGGVSNPNNSSVSVYGPTDGEDEGIPKTGENTYLVKCVSIY